VIEGAAPASATWATSECTSNQKVVATTNRVLSAPAQLELFALLCMRTL
jgi:hypothetical protein